MTTWSEFEEKYKDVIDAIVADDGNMIGAWRPGFSAARDMLVKEAEKQSGHRWTDAECFGVPDGFDFHGCYEDIEAIRKAFE